ncbi:Copper-sensing transcriptional repressor CsoR [Pirellulimonas nuda]|uniref:Copper-sensing transcriptional repressor CsoR n=1 Tax=Pirellulimonas nuda TaxID=2528009 RepID=A0A518DDP4_9BACT|nr:Copper-sensing transcriptional repressor CsoR [Pirellulimonas nuda]
MLSEDEKSKLANRLRRISGQVAAVHRMMDEDAYCVEILTQIAAANGALGKVGQIILESHIKSCVAAALECGNS